MSKPKINTEMIGALDYLEKEKGIKKEIVIEALEQALESAYKQNYGDKNVEVEFNSLTGNIKVYAVKTITDDEEAVEADSNEFMSLADARKLPHGQGYDIGDEIREEVTPRDFGRIAAQTAKQVVMQRLREEERKIIYDKYKTYENEIITGEVSREDKRFTYVDLGDGVEGAMGFRDKMPNEHYHVHDRIQVYVTKVNDDRRGPQIFVSRTAPELLKRLFEREVPEIKDGTVLIENIAREAGDRAKVAVYSNDPNVDPVGTCVGPRGSRVQAIVNELDGENMDIVEYVKDPAKFIANALNPAEVLDVIFNEEKTASETEDSEGEETTEGQTERSCTVVVPDSQLSLAIGKRGQNARLAARLTKYKIDIKSESEMAENDQESEEVADSEENIDNNEE
ncbi:transcription termination/antitermination protein NusA [Limosilactobacillus reuteri]|uniref:Transcription termination/antitermination protein NusA n=3 Tax=Limosilactobacillus reuteri TaxID=1598 RepID=A0A1V4FM34_LIMRT|nr:transcription termination factor NusA [Limosilactobacillus reuteri]CCC03011.1 transcription termination-antitermination factor [Limosilactobacillus reuteri subsp. suis]AGN99423.1 transcription termination-antitermination factor [Limosilactobacillus reuteri I5007]AMY13403.1 transcription termination/antitermination protein NusA [Limosilactobacillus reuteri]MCC4340119.1 transcription termination factor NusA [Limosilactobacillus reuteri]MCC4343870.1 transcription termination factor NusA [Limos